MDDLQSEKEQLEEIRAWWSEYGTVIVVAIVIAVGGIFGWNAYNDDKLADQITASELFEVLAVHVTAGKLDAAESVADDLATNYANTAYAAQARLAMARLYMDQNRDQDAADNLRELLATNADDTLKNVARIRLAHVLLYQDKPQEVIDLLSGVGHDAFRSLYDEQLGDAYAALGQYDKAGDAYRRALTEPSDPGQNPVVDTAYVQMKLSDLPQGTVAEIVDEPAIEGGDSE